VQGAGLKGQSAIEFITFQKALRMSKKKLDERRKLDEGYLEKGI